MSTDEVPRTVGERALTDAAIYMRELERDKETAERALLDAWEHQGELDTWCAVCGEYGSLVPGEYRYTYKHTPDCIIPSLLERYGEGT